MLPVNINNSIPQQAYRAETVRNHELAVAANSGVLSMQLMQYAGESAFNLLRHRYPQAKTILVVCGSGNNAGDGLILARMALEANFHVYVHSVVNPESYQGDAKRAYQQFMEQGGQFHKFNDIDVSRIDVIVDGLLGTGITGNVRENYRYVIELINQLPAPILALDIPSGLHANTGMPMGSTVIADATVTFVVLKQGLVTGLAIDYCGDVFLSGLGIKDAFEKSIDDNVRLVCENNLPRLKARLGSSHKGDSGRVLLVGGNLSTPGAIKLAAEATLRCGAGLVSVACHPDNATIVLANRPEIMRVSDFTQQLTEQLSLSDSIVLGPGLGLDEWAQALFMKVLSTEKPVIVDGDGLNLLAKNPQSRNNWILTPHPKEAARLLDTSVENIMADRFEAVKSIALKYGGVCILKGAGTLISNGNVVTINTSGNPGMASGGMGDLLAGILGALRLQSASDFDACCRGVFIHGQAADIAREDGEKGMLASDLLPILRQLVNRPK
ncbi:NAD(P)H-hydrate dehydratase [Thalassotalea litorea]|uniref:Bifunctional NAD(P)H-hydrate repair enzyme n=1 Tax=Thalassotalea litorea TaxID=2020715 RepID=A0A5R9IJW0_9GAMM|nr:NAD(P)H-hydrate dehydratase [Thalassotalea litorea]TLU65834.1 NAD(P)H-hydrate dehydratase [Thalassotalea litorea]